MHMQVKIHMCLTLLNQEIKRLSHLNLNKQRLS